MVRTGARKISPGNPPELLPPPRGGDWDLGNAVFMRVCPQPHPARPLKPPLTALIVAIRQGPKTGTGMGPCHPSKWIQPGALGAPGGTMLCGGLWGHLGAAAPLKPPLHHAGTRVSSCSGARGVPWSGPVDPPPPQNGPKRWPQYQCASCMPMLHVWGPTQPLL